MTKPEPILPPEKAKEASAGKTAGAADKPAPSPEPPPPVKADQAAIAWWERFAEAVEDPEISTYDFLKDSMLRKLELDDSKDVGDFLSKAQRKAVKEIIALTDVKELRDTVKKLEGNKLLFNGQTRVVIQTARVLLDTFISAKDEYDAEVAKKMAEGEKAPSAEQRKEEIERIVEKKLAEPQVSQQLGKMAHALTGKNKDDIQQTLEKASKELRERKSVAQVMRDAVGISKKYMTLDNMVNIGINVLPLITWQYRWALAAVLGVYVSRMAAYHGFKAGRAYLGGDKDRAKEEGQKTLKALKAAGGNALAIAITPAVARLPAQLAIWGAFAVSYVYNTAIDLGHKALAKKREMAPQGFRGKLKQFWSWLKGSVKENEDSLIGLAAKSVRTEMPNEVTANVETAANKVKMEKTRRVIRGMWGVTKAGARRMTRVFNEAAHATAGVAAAAGRKISAGFNALAQHHPATLLGKGDAARPAKEQAEETPPAEKPEEKPPAIGGPS